MKRKISGAALVFSFLFLLPLTTYAKQKTDMRPDYVDLNLFIGMEQLDSADWSPNDRMSKIGADITFVPSYFLADLVASLFYSTDSGTKDGLDMKTTLLEGQLGLKKNYVIDAYPEITPSLSGGLALVTYTNDFESATDGSGTGIGVFAGAGVVYTYNEKVNLGVDLRCSYVPVFDGDEYVNAGGITGGLLLGYRWSSGW
ncbi:hypothetical protein EPN96_08930 [bacterium]|nr:MAG: hypothetical protein EPN96_08930 [bacterium]